MTTVGQLQKATPNQTRFTGSGKQVVIRLWTARNRALDQSSNPRFDTSSLTRVIPT